MIELSNIKLGLDESEKLLKKKAAKALRLDSGSIKKIKILKKSLDARKKSDIHWLYTLAISVEGSEEKLLARAKNKNAMQGIISLHDVRSKNVSYAHNLE